MLLLQLLRVNANISNFNIETTFAIDFYRLAAAFAQSVCTNFFYKLFAIKSI